MNMLFSRISFAYEKFDEKFERLSKRDKIIISLMPVLISLYVTMYFIVPYYDSEKNLLTDEKNRLLMELKTKSDTMATLSRYGSTESDLLQNLEKKLLLKLSELDKIKDKKDYYNLKLTEFSSTKRDWYSFLTFLTEKSNIYKLSIDNIKNKNIAEEIKNLGFVRSHTVLVKGESDFNNLLIFIKEIESYSSFVEIESIELVGKDTGTISFEMRLNGWEIKF